MIEPLDIPEQNKLFSRNNIVLLLILAVAAMHLFDKPIDTTETYKRASRKAIETVVILRTEVIPGRFAHGGGVIISSDGYILSADHVVISSNTKISIYPDLEQTYSAQIVARFPKEDIAIIKLEDPPVDLRWAQIADSTDLKVMDPVVTIGHPRQCWWSVTDGRLNNRFERGGNMLQIDAIASYGSSGGGIFNLMGDLVGIFQAKIVYGPPYPPDGQLNIGIESADLLYVLDVYDIIRNHRLDGRIILRSDTSQISNMNTPETYLPMPDLN